MSIQGRRVGTLESLAIFDHVRVVTPTTTTFTETEFYGRNSGGNSATDNCALIGGVLPNQASGRYLGVQFGISSGPVKGAASNGAGADMRNAVGAIQAMQSVADFEVWIGDILAHRGPIRQYGSPGVLVQGVSSNWGDNTTGSAVAIPGVASTHYSSGPALEHQIGANQIIRVRMFPRNGKAFPVSIDAAPAGGLVVNCSLIVAMATGVVVQ